MLPDFFSAKKQLTRKLMRELRTQIDASAPIFSQIRAYVMAEGDTFSYQTFDGNIEKQKFKAWTQRMEVQADLPPQQLQAEMEKKFREITEAAGRHFETSLFDTVREATEKTGMGFDAGGKPFHPSMPWDMLERMDVDFDTNGEPVMPTLVVHPDMFKAIEKKIPEWESDPELQKRRNGVLAKKKGEWLDREARRKLVG